ncbi:MAG: hypothetical protein GVY29_12575 [Spirochaetes bacterium]|jgi:hypothetical protein|nr:hypothetical protein [Spirochaetota bacterium]
MIDDDLDEIDAEDYDDVEEPDGGAYEVEEDFDEWYSDHANDRENDYELFDD